MTPTNRRFSRQIDRIGTTMPRLGRALAALTAPGRTWIRLPAAIVMITGGLLGFLPILGFWMLPLGLILLAVDLPPLRPAVGGVIVRGRAFLRRWRARR